MSDDDFELPPDPMDSVTAIILAGGRGQRMGTNAPPKCLTPLRGRPLIFHLIDSLKFRGIRRFIVCVGYRATEVVDAVVSQYPGEVMTSQAAAGEDATMGERLESAFLDLTTPHALVCYGDTLADINLTEMWDRYAQREAAMALATVPYKSEFGIVDGETRVSKIVEKPRLPHWVNIGYVLCQNWTFLRLGVRDSIVDWVNRLAESDIVLNHRHTGFHVTVNSPKDIEEAERHMGDTT